MNMQTNLSNQTSKHNLQEFLVGDVVVLTEECRSFKSNDLFEVKNKTLTRLWTIKSENHLILVSSKEIRTATVAELNAKRRLTSAEQALAEVS
ncbi:putative transcription factor [Acinetobacter phage AM106]|nr:putative transcription factor [Acinetobacter phage AM106]